MMALLAGGGFQLLLLLAVAATATTAAPSPPPPIGRHTEYHLRRHLDFTLNLNCRPPHQDECLDSLSPDFASQFADYCHELNADSIQLDVLPDAGWATFPSRTVPVFPALAKSGVDWLGGVVTALRAKNITPIFYMNVRESYRLATVGGLSNETFHFSNGSVAAMEPGVSFCYNSDGWLQRLVILTKEVVAKYRPAALRYDGLYGTVTDCTTPGDRRFYESQFGEPMPPRSTWQASPPHLQLRQVDFYRRSISRMIKGLRRAALSADPEVLTWFNGFASPAGKDVRNWNNVDVGHEFSSVAFLEEATVFLQRWIQAAINPSHGVINGCLLQTGRNGSARVLPSAWESSAYGGLNYQFFAVNHRTGMPAPQGDLNAGFNATTIRRFYGTLATLHPILDGATPLTLPVAVMISEATRWRYEWATRKPYMTALENLFSAFHARYSIAPSMLSTLDLLDAPTLRSKYRLLVLLESSGLSYVQSETLRQYIAIGGTVIFSGDALRFNASGSERRDFALPTTAPIGQFVRFNKTYCNRQSHAWQLALHTEWAAMGRVVEHRMGGANLSLSSGPQCLNEVSMTSTAVPLLSTVIGTAPPQSHNLVIRSHTNSGRLLYVASKSDNSVGGQSSLAADILAATIEVELQLAASPNNAERSPPAAFSALPFRVMTARPGGYGVSEVVVTSLSPAYTAGTHAVFFLHPRNVTVEFAAETLNVSQVVSLYPATGWGVDATRTPQGLSLRVAFGANLEFRVAVLKTDDEARDPLPQWSGPSVRLLPSGRLRIAPASPHPAESLPATWVAVNAPLRRVWHNSTEGWEIFDLQLKLARQAGVRVLSMVLNEWEFATPSTDHATLASRAYALDGIRRAVAVWPEVYLILRLVLQTTGAKNVVEKNESGAQITPVLCCGDYRGQLQNASSLAGSWAATTAQRLRASLMVLDGMFPGRIIGVHLMGLHTGEWFKPPASPYGSAEAADGAWAWDFSPAMCADFVMATPRCADLVPSVKTLDTPTVGNSWLDGSSLASSCAIAWNRFMSATVARALTTLSRAVKDQSEGKCLVTVYNGYVYSLGIQPGVGHWEMASLTANSTIDMIASPLLYGPPTRAPWGAPMVMGALDSPAIYGKMWAMESDTRTFLCASVPAACAGNNFSSSIASTVQLFRRNLGSAAVRGQAAYMLDLDTNGWLGQPKRLADSQALWQGIGQLLRTIGTITSEQDDRPTREDIDIDTDHTTSPRVRLAAQIAVFSDATSMDLAPLSGPHCGTGAQDGGSGCPWFAQNGLKLNAISLSTLGAPVLHLSTEDLLSDRLDTSQIRMAVFLNGIHLAPGVIAAIRSRFAQQPAMLVWLGASGLVPDLTSAADMTAPARLTGIPVQCDMSISASLSMRFTGAGGFTPAALPAYNPAGGCRPSPSCFVDPMDTEKESRSKDPSGRLGGGTQTTTVLATETVASGACVNISTGRAIPCATMVLKRNGNMAAGGGSATVWTSAIALPWAAWRLLAINAGVHLYVETNGASPPATVPLGDSIAISPLSASDRSATWIHITAACPGLSDIYARACMNTTRTRRMVALPRASRVTDEAGGLVCTSCTTFRTEPLSPGDVVMFRLSNLELLLVNAPPLNIY